MLSLCPNRTDRNTRKREGAVCPPDPSTIEILLPFWGFYESHHGEAIRETEERLLHDDHGDAYPDLADRYENGVTVWYEKAYEAYAKHYCEEFSQMDRNTAVTCALRVDLAA